MPAAHPRPLFCNVPAGPFRSELVPGDPFSAGGAFWNVPAGLFRRVPADGSRSDVKRA